MQIVTMDGCEPIIVVDRATPLRIGRVVEGSRTLGTPAEAR